METFSTGINNGRVLKIKTSIKVEDLKNYPKIYKKNIIRNEEKVLVKWIKLDRFDGKKSVIANVRQNLDFGKYQQIERLLMHIDNMESEIYFAGLGSVMKGSNNEKLNFYQFMYFLNVKTNEIYELDYID